MVRLCSAEAVPDGAARGFRADPGDPDSPRIVLVRRGDSWWAYRNRCPHRGTPLDWLPDRFLDERGEHLVCATHGAVFRVEDGRCIAGPCAGDALEPLAIRVQDGGIFLARPQGRAADGR